MLKVGISASFFHTDFNRPVFKGKTLLYLEQSLVHWVGSQNALPFLVPTVDIKNPLKLRDLVNALDGLILQGGSDVAPETYGETPLQPEWKGDAIRDEYEIDLIKEFMAHGKPVLGVCRGAQIINVALGGTLYQDIGTQVPGALVHRNWEIYDQNSHYITFEPGSRLQRLYGTRQTAKVNSVHHQAVKELGKGLLPEARSEKDGILEAIRLDSDIFVSAVQWHPEFHDPNDATLLESAPLLRDFLDEIRKRKGI